MVAPAPTTTRDVRGDLGRYVELREVVLGGRTLSDLAELVDIHVPYWHHDGCCPLCGTWRDRLARAVDQ